MSGPALYLVRVRHPQAEAAVAQARRFLAGVAPLHGVDLLGAISFAPRRAEAATPAGGALLRRLRTERQLLRLASALRFDHQLELLGPRLPAGALDRARRRYLETVGPRREGPFLRRLLAPLRPEELSTELRRHSYECFVAYAQNTTQKSFPFATAGAHFESCRLFDLGGQGPRRYVWFEAQLHGGGC